MDLDTMLQEVGSNIGRQPTFSAQFVRELSVEDIPSILHPPKSIAPAATIKNMRHRHHTAARLVAEGRTTTEVAAITGYTAARISLFKSMPDFQELIAGYCAQKDALYLDVHGRKADLHAAIIDELADRLEESPHKFTNRELSELIKNTANDPGEGGAPLSGVSVNINFVSPAADHTTKQSSPSITIDGEVID
jgi:hypothetical protein